MISEKEAKKINVMLHEIAEKHGLIELLSQMSVVCAQRCEYKHDVTGKPLFVALDKFICELKKVKKAA